MNEISTLVMAMMDLLAVRNGHFLKERKKKQCKVKKMKNENNYFYSSSSTNCFFKQLNE